MTRPVGDLRETVWPMECDIKLGSSSDNLPTVASNLGEQIVYKVFEVWGGVPLREKGTKETRPSNER